MNWLYWTLEFIKAIAWPVVALCGLLLFRRELSGLMERGWKATLGNLSIEFEKKQQEVTSNVMAANNQIGTTSTTISFGTGLQENDPVSIVSRAWMKVEAKVDELVRRAGENPADMATIIDKLNVLVRAKLLNEMSSKSVEGLFQLKELAHRGVDVEKAKDFAVLADATLYALSMDQTK